MVRVAGLLIQQLEKKQPIHNNLIKQLKDANKQHTPNADGGKH